MGAMPWLIGVVPSARPIFALQAAQEETGRAVNQERLCLWIATFLVPCIQKRWSLNLGLGAWHRR